MYDDFSLAKIKIVFFFTFFNKIFFYPKVVWNRSLLAVKVMQSAVTF